MNKKVYATSHLQDTLFFSKVAHILGISDKKLGDTLLEKHIPFHVLNILQIPEYEENQELVVFALEQNTLNFSQISPKLRNNPGFLVKLVSQNPNSFFQLEIIERENIDYRKASITGFVKQKKNFIFIDSFIKEQTQDKLERQELFDFYVNYLKTLKYIFSNDIEKHLFAIRKDNPRLCETLLDENIIEKKGSFLKISDKTHYIAKQVYQEILLSSEVSKDAFLDKLFTGFGFLETKKLYSYLAIWESLYEEIYLEQNQTHIQNTQEFGGGDGENISDEQGENLQQYYQDKLAYSLPYSHSFSITDKSYQVYYNDQKSVELSFEEIESMTLLALQNYIFFLKVFDELGLSFLSETYKDQFLHVGEVHYDSGEGITESKLLKLLNIVGKNIGIPEEHYQIDGEEDKKIGCFETLGGAKLVFRDIKETGKINDTLICPPSKKGSRAITEIYMTQNNLVGKQGEGLILYEWH